MDVVWTLVVEQVDCMNHCRCLKLCKPSQSLLRRSRPGHDSMGSSRDRQKKFDMSARVLPVCRPSATLLENFTAGRRILRRHRWKLERSPRLGSWCRNQRLLQQITHRRGLRRLSVRDCACGFFRTSDVYWIRVFPTRFGSCGLFATCILVSVIRVKLTVFSIRSCRSQEFTGFLRRCGRHE